MASAGGGAAELRPNNVSVTAINVDNTNYYSNSNNSNSSNNAVTVNITDNHQPTSDDLNNVTLQQHSSALNFHSSAQSDSDSEVAQIDFKAHPVNLRNKNGESKVGEVVRPMSWEGELSDSEIATMCIDEDASSSQNAIIPENLSIICNQTNLQTNQTQSSSSSQPSIGATTSNTATSTPPGAVRLKQSASSAVVNNYSLHSTPSHSPLLNQRPLGHRQLNVPPTPSPDSAVHSGYSVFSSPSQSPLTQRHVTLTPSLSRNNSDASHSSCYSYSSVSVSVSPTQQFSPTHSPIQGRHLQHNSPLHHNNLYRNISDVETQHINNASSSYYGSSSNCRQLNNSDISSDLLIDPANADDNDDKTNISQTSLPTGQSISRQQLINSPCPICGDKISGFHYGIFSCESCKGFFKRTVQNRKNYVCLRGALCPVTVITRKKCPACRFDKCLQCGMKLEAIREDRTRGGRSTYQCSYSVPPSITAFSDYQSSPNTTGIKLEPSDNTNSSLTASPSSYSSHKRLSVPPLLQEIMDVEHLWHYNELELTKLSNEANSLGNKSNSSSTSPNINNLTSNPLIASTNLNTDVETSPDFLANLCSIADHRLYKIVKWCKSLPLFKNISIDDQICLLINSWCELLLFSCCFRSMSTPGEIRVSLGKSINLSQAREMGSQACIERMLNFTENLRRLRVDRYEYVAMKVIVLLTSDASELREAEKVRASQEKALQALQAYTLAHYPDSPAKFGELLLRIPDLQRTCQVGKEMFSIKSKEGEGSSFNLLMELLRGDH